jgi:hypothetical protein
MAITNFPTDTEITAIQSGTYDWSANEKPVPSSKLNGMVESFKQLCEFLKDPSPQLDQELWTNIASFQNSWVNYGGSIHNVGYRKNSLGNVELRGMTRDGSTTSGGTIFTLPTGYRPAKEMYFAVAQLNTSIPYSTIFIAPDGRVGVYSAGNTGLSFDNVSFSVL